MGLTATLDSRYSFTAQFLMGAALLARSARQVEEKPAPTATEEDFVAHRSHVVGAIMQSVAALESASWEVSKYGPGYHLGSNGVDLAAKAIVEPVAERIDRNRVVERYRVILHLLGKPTLDRGAQPWQAAALVVRLRNELVHYKSRWTSEHAAKKLISSLRALKHPHPPFYGSHAFFPHQCLSAACAAWAVRSCVAFVDRFHEHLGVQSPLAAYEERISEFLG